VGILIGMKNALKNIVSYFFIAIYFHLMQTFTFG